MLKTKEKRIEDEDLLDLEEMLSYVDNGWDKEYKKLHKKITSRSSKEYDTNAEFNEHQNTIRNYIINEYKTKMFYRKFSFWTLMGITFSLLIFIYLFLFVKSDTVSISFLITLTVSVFANLMALISIVFKYVFSSTTEIIDYATVLADQEKDKNK